MLLFLEITGSPSPTAIAPMNGTGKFILTDKYAPVKIDKIGDTKKMKKTIKTIKINKSLVTENTGLLGMRPKLHTKQEPISTVVDRTPNEAAHKPETVIPGSTKPNDKPFAQDPSISAYTRSAGHRALINKQ